MGIIEKIYKRRENQKRELREKALKDARRIARFLVERFGAKEVILYGSLAEDRYFDEASDIDLAVKGLDENYFKAYGYCLGLSEFDVDLRVYEDMPLRLQAKIDREGKYLYGRQGT